MDRTTKNQSSKPTNYYPKENQAQDEERKYGPKCQYRNHKNKHKDKKFRSRHSKQDNRKHKHQTQEVTKILNSYYKNDQSLLNNLKEQKQRILEQSSEQFKLDGGRERLELDKAIKRLERRECFDEFRGHRNNNTIYKQSQVEKHKNFQQRVAEIRKQFGFYCPSCFGYDYDSQQGQPVQPPSDDQSQDLDQLVDCQFYFSADTVMKQLEGKDMWDYEKLSLGESRITNEGVKSLSMGLWDGLLSLHLGVNNINNISCKYIAKMEMPVLSSLDLGKNPIQAEGFRHLSKGQWPELKKIFLNSNIGLSFLWKGHFPKLQELFIKSPELAKDIKNRNIRNYVNLVRMGAQSIHIRPALNRVKRNGFRRSKSGNRLIRRPVEYFQGEQYFVVTERMRPTLQTLENILMDKNYKFQIQEF